MGRVVVIILTFTLLCAAAQPGTDAFAPLIGQHVYACADATLYAVAAPMQPPTSWGARVTPYGFPRLEPLTIVSARETAKVGPIHVIAAVVKTSDGRIFGTVLHAENATDSLRSILEFSNSHLYAAVPSFVRKDFLYLVRGMLVEKGMSMDEVECSLGMPAHMNDFGEAGTQWVYNGGHTMVYFQDGIVADVQQIN